MAAFFGSNFASMALWSPFQDSLLQVQDQCSQPGARTPATKGMKVCSESLCEFVWRLCNNDKVSQRNHLSDRMFLRLSTRMGKLEASSKTWGRTVDELNVDQVWRCYVMRLFCDASANSEFDQTILQISSNHKDGWILCLNSFFWKTRFRGEIMTFKDRSKDKHCICIRNHVISATLFRFCALRLERLSLHTVQWNSVGRIFPSNRSHVYRDTWQEMVAGQGKQLMLQAWREDRWFSLECLRTWHGAELLTWNSTTSNHG